MKRIKGDVWDIPPEKMKMKRRHVVPLARQVKAILEELKPLTGNGCWLFPTPRNNGHCIRIKLMQWWAYFLDVLAALITEATLSTNKRRGAILRYAFAILHYF